MKEAFFIAFSERIKNLGVLLILILSINLIGYPQFSFYKNYTSNDGLPSSKIYDMLQDGKGYMWFATENGVSRFDGYGFRNFTTEDGLPANSTIRLYEDYKGRIWFSSYQGRLSYFENEKIIQHELNDHLISLEMPEFFDYIYIDTTETIWLTPFVRGLYSIAPKNKINMEFTKGAYKKSKEFTIYYFFENNELIVWILANNDSIQFSKELMNKNFNSIEIKYESELPYYQNYHCIMGENDYLFSLGVYLIRVVNGKVVWSKKFENEILAIYKDLSENVWISENFHYLYMYPGGDLEASPVNYLPNKIVSKIVQDYEGNYWFSTTDHGVYCVPSIQFTNYTKEKLNIDYDHVLTLETSQDQLFFTTNNKEIHSFSIIDNKLKKNNHFNIRGFKISNIYDLLITDDKYLWVSDSEDLIYDLDGNSLQNKTHKHIAGYGFLKMYDNSIVLGQRRGYNHYVDFELVYESRLHDFNKQVFKLIQTKDSTLLLGTHEGLYKYKVKYLKYNDTCPVLNSRVSDIKLNNGELWVGTFNNGIVIETKHGLKYINKGNGLNANRIKVIFFENDKHVWVGTNKGLSHIFLSNLDSNMYQISNYSIWDGLPSNEINDIIKIEDLLWLATDNGLVSFNPGEIAKLKVAPRINLEKVLVNGQKTNLTINQPLLKNDQNNISVDFKAISFKHPGSITYNYRLEGLEEVWQETPNTSVRYPELPYGEYKFVVKAKNYSGIMSSPLEYNFIIQKHFTQTIFFLLFILVCILGFALIIFFFFFRMFKRREELKHQILLSEQVAVRAQMNPHFIFNALNSIQDFVLRRDDKNANFYLANFSTLMRKILETSKNNTISLQEEIETMKIYLDLEKLRFEGLFNYNINIDKSINPAEIFIPTLLLQTYIENAIWHGLVPKNAEGLLELDFMLLRDNKLLISISDNGIGRKKASEISRKRKHHRSMGMKKTDERIKLINKLNKTNITVEVIDLYYENNIAKGTRIEITFDV